MIVTTTPSVEGYQIADYKGIVTGEAIMGANIVQDLFAGISDIAGVDLDYEVINNMLMVSTSGTAVVLG